MSTINGTTKAQESDKNYNFGTSSDSSSEKAILKSDAKLPGNIGENLISSLTLENGFIVPLLS